MFMSIICVYSCLYVTTYLLCVIDSRDNISAVVARLPGVNLGPESGGGVAKLRADRTKSTHAVLQSSLDGEEHSG